MAKQNLYCPGLRINTKEFQDGWDLTFGKKEPKITTVVSQAAITQNPDVVVRNDTDKQVDNETTIPFPGEKPTPINLKIGR